MKVTFSATRLLDFKLMEKNRRSQEEPDNNSESYKNIQHQIVSEYLTEEKRNETESNKINKQNKQILTIPNKYRLKKSKNWKPRKLINHCNMLKVNHVIYETIKFVTGKFHSHNKKKQKKTHYATKIQKQDGRLD